MKAVILLLSASALISAVPLEIKPFRRLIPADVLRGEKKDIQYPSGWEGSLNILNYQ